MDKLVRLYKNLLGYSEFEEGEAALERARGSVVRAKFLEGLAQAHRVDACLLKRALAKSGVDFERGLKVAESEAIDDLTELDLALRGLEWAVVNLRESLMDVVSGLVRNLQQEDQTDE